MVDAMFRLRTLVAVLCGGAALLGGGIAEANLPYGVVEVDYLSSLQITDRHQAPAPYDPKEFPGGAPGTAWVRSGGTRQVKYVFLNPTNVAHTATVTAENGVFYGFCASYPVTATPDSPTISFPAGGTAEVTFTLSGFPNHVTLGDLRVDLTVESAYAGLTGAIEERLYFTDAYPLGASHGHQIPVWAEVLEDACRFACTAVGPSAVRQATTYKLFHSHRDFWTTVFVYEGTQLRWARPAPGGSSAVTNWTFKLSEFAAAREVSRYVNGQCTDVSMYLIVLTSALGVPLLGVEQRPNSPGYPVPSLSFETHPLVPIGSDSSDPGLYLPTTWQFHQHNRYGPDVFDSCLALPVDLGGAAWMNPIWQWPLETPPALSYWQTEIVPAPPSGSKFRGLAFRYEGQTTPQGSVVQRTVKQARLVALQYPSP